MVTRGVSFGPTAGTADTKTTIGSAYTFALTGRIKQICVSGSNQTADKSTSAILTLDFKRLSGPFTWSVNFPGNVVGDGGGPVGNSPIDVDIPYENGEVVTVSLTCSDTEDDCIVSLTCVE